MLAAGKLLAASNAPATAAYVDYAITDVGGSGLTSHSPTIDIGAEDADRFVVIGVTGRGNSNGAFDVTAMTINGVTASQLAQSGVGDESNKTELWGVVVPTGTTGVTVAITFSQNVVRSVIGSWDCRISDGVQDTAGGVNSGSINCPADGVIIGMASGMDTAGDVDFVWTNLTEKFDVYSGTNYTNGSGAHDEFASAQTARAISVTNCNRLCLVSLR